MAWYFNNRCKEQEERKPEDEIELMSQDIGVYLEYAAGRVSGENLNMIGRTLLRLFEAYLTSMERAKLETLLKKLRRAANQANPPVRKAANALRLDDLQYMLGSSEYHKLSQWEKQAIDILVVAFATVSRVAEIVSLTTGDVTENGHYISVRTKTYASTCQRHVKYVSNALGLYPSRILQSRRAAAILQGRTLLYSGQTGRDVPVTSSDVTHALKRVTRKLKMMCRITAHSGRKGAAVAALLAGVPLVVIQSLGLWRCIDSLQAYLGESLRQEFCVLDFLKRGASSARQFTDKAGARTEGRNEAD